MDSNSLQHKTFLGMVWGFFEKFSMQFVTFIVGVVLARLLSPRDYGLIAMTTVFVAISGAIVDSGFSSALIRKPQREAIDFSTVFDINIVLSFIVGVFLCLISPLVASFYNEPLLKSILCVNGLYVFLGSFLTTQSVKLQVDLRFKEKGIINVVNSISVGLISILFAYNGFGVWSLVIPRFFSLFTGAFLYWHFMHWFPGVQFSKDSAKSMFSFGSNLLVSCLLDTIYNNLYSIVIGKKFSSENLGYYSKASGFANLPSTTITGVVGGVAFPILSKIQFDETHLASVYRKLIKLSAFIVFPIMMGLAVLAKPFVCVLITEKWMESVPYLQILCFALLLYPIHALNLNLLQVKGRSDLFLRLEVIKKVLGVIVLVLTIPMGVLWMCIGLVIHSVLALFINTYYTGKLLQLNVVTQIKDLFPSFMYSAMMMGAIYLLTAFIKSYLLSLILGSVVGIGFYFTISYLFKSEEFQYLTIILKNNVISKFR